MFPTLVYGCEVWNLSKQHESRVQATQMRVLRRIEGVSRVDKVRNEDIWARLHGSRRYSRCSKKKTGGVEGQTGRNE